MSKSIIPHRSDPPTISLKWRNVIGLSGMAVGFGSMAITGHLFDVNLWYNALVVCAVIFVILSVLCLCGMWFSNRRTKYGRPHEHSNNRARDG